MLTQESGIKEKSTNRFIGVLSLGMSGEGKKRTNKKKKDKIQTKTSQEKQADP